LELHLHPGHQLLQHLCGVRDWSHCVVLLPNLPLRCPAFSLLTLFWRPAAAGCSGACLLMQMQTQQRAQHTASSTAAKFIHYTRPRYLYWHRGCCSASCCSGTCFSFSSPKKNRETGHNPKKTESRLYPLAKKSHGKGTRFLVLLLVTLSPHRASQQTAPVARPGAAEVSAAPPGAPPRDPRASPDHPTWWLVPPGAHHGQGGKKTAQPNYDRTAAVVLPAVGAFRF
jgi:hypothetical protein